MNENTTRTEYALDYGAGLMCIDSDSTDAAEMKQFIPDSRVVTRTVTEGEWHPVDQEPDTGPDLSLIPSSREEARPVEVNGVVGTYWRSDRCLMAEDPGVPDATEVANLSVITSVREVHVLADDQVAVPRELVEQARAWCQRKPGTRYGADILHDFAAVDRGEGS